MNHKLIKEIKGCPGKMCDRRNTCLRYKASKTANDNFEKDACSFIADGHEFHGWKKGFLMYDNYYMEIK